MSSDIKEQQIDYIQISPYYALQLDEPTDFAGQAQLLTYVRYVREKEIEDILFCRPLQIRTTGEAIFNVLDSFIQDSGLGWGKCIGLCTDRARSMTGRERGLVARFQQVAPLVQWTHCMVVACCQENATLFESVLHQGVKIINHIKARPLNSRLF